MALEVLAINSDNLVRLDVLTNASSGAYVNSATVTFTLKDSTGAVFQGQSGISMPYVAASNGRYEGTLTAAISNQLTPNALYTIEITATYSGTQLFRKLSCIAKYRSTQ
jgi:hypothetical protein